MATSNGKETIYIDIDDEITTIIEKVRASNEKIVALVLPKRATVLQSIVNMKLLKRTADTAKKSLVLITAEAGLLPLAGTVGLYVAKTLQTKPEIPVVPGQYNDDEELADEDEPSPSPNAGFTIHDSADRPVGELAGAVAPAIADEAIETLELDDSDDADDESEETVATDTKADKAKKKKDKKDKKLAIPNFNKFRMRLFLLIPILLLLIIGFYVANNVLPKASLVITTDTSDINSNLSLTADTTVKTLNVSTLTLPAQIQKLDKTGSQQVPTTGKKNNGTTATGSITLSLPDCSVSQVTIPAGTGVSTNGLVFITQADATLQSVSVGSSCKNSSFPTFSTATISVVSQTAGSQYNVAPSTFKVSGYPGVAASSSAAFTGGTDNIIQVVAQADIDNATQKIAAQNSDAVKQQLEQQLQNAGMYALTATFAAGTPTVTPSANVGDQVGTVSVTQTTTYTMFGVKQADIKTLVDNDIKDKIDPSKQSILSEGLDKATFHVNSASATSVQFAMSTVATAGPDLQADTIKSEITGKKSGDIQALLKQDPGVSSVDVHFSPFWVVKAPSKTSKITVTFQKEN